MEKGRAGWTTSRALRQASRVTSCYISFSGLFFHPETGHCHKPDGKHGSEEGSQSTEKTHMDTVKITHAYIHSLTKTFGGKVSSLIHTYKLFHRN